MILCLSRGSPAGFMHGHLGGGVNQVRGWGGTPMTQCQMLTLFSMQFLHQHSAALVARFDWAWLFLMLGYSYAMGIFKHSWMWHQSNVLFYPNILQTFAIFYLNVLKAITIIGLNFILSIWKVQHGFMHVWKLVIIQDMLTQLDFVLENMCEFSGACLHH